jgi:hypothetical protein
VKGGSSARYPAAVLSHAPGTVNGWPSRSGPRVTRINGDSRPVHEVHRQPCSIHHEPPYSVGLRLTMAMWRRFVFVHRGAVRTSKSANGECNGWRRRQDAASARSALHASPDVEHAHPHRARIGSGRREPAAGLLTTERGSSAGNRNRQ